MEEGIGTPICQLTVSVISAGKNKGRFRVTVGDTKSPFSASSLSEALDLVHLPIMVALGRALPTKTRKPKTETTKARSRTRKPEMAGA